MWLQIHQYTNHQYIAIIGSPILSTAKFSRYTIIENTLYMYMYICVHL